MSIEINESLHIDASVIETVTETPGQLAYEAYCGATGNRTYSGAPTLAWGELPANIQNAWETSAHRTRLDTLGEIIGELKAAHAEMGL